MQLLRPELVRALTEQGLPTEARIAVLDLDDAVALLLAHLGPSGVVPLTETTEVVRFARGRGVSIVLASAAMVPKVLLALGPDAGELPIVAVGPTRPLSGLFAIAQSLEDDAFWAMVRRALTFRALRSLELLHRCEARRLLRREAELIGSITDELSDDVATHQPPPLPVGRHSRYEFEPLAELFERAYIDRVQLLAESAREAARHLDVSAATLARRLRREASPVTE